MSKRDFKFPLATLIRQAGRLSGALAHAIYGAPVIARLPATFATGFNTLLGKVGGEPATKSSQMGDTGTLTQAQDTAFTDMLRLMSAARRSASLAFRGNHVVLHEEFQVGNHEPQGLPDEVKRARIIHTATVKYAAELAAEGWTAGDGTQLDNAITLLSGVDLQQEMSKAVGPGLTGISTADANQLFHKCQTIQNAARLQYPSTQPGNETPRALYLLGEFPPHSGSHEGDTTPPAGGPPVHP